MIKVLQELGEVEGVIGSLIVDPDGITVAENLDADADLVAAACVQIVNACAMRWPSSRKMNWFRP